jgi:hypothetical protein
LSLLIFSFSGSRNKTSGKYFVLAWHIAYCKLPYKFGTQ